MLTFYLVKGIRGGVVVEALRYKPERRGFDSLWNPRSRVRSRPKPSDFSLMEKNPQHAIR
jgi:hypothetical protein